MPNDVTQGHTSWVRPLDESLYDLDEEQVNFFKTATGIQGDEEVKRHIIAVQTKAFEIYQYPSIRIFEFARLKIARLPAYPDLLRLGKERKGAILLDLGCCFGNDAYKAVQDGYPSENVIASDLSKPLWDLGYELFRATPESFPVAFVAGDVLDPSFLAVPDPANLSPPPTSPPPALNTLTSLNPLRGHISAVFAGAFFHLFSFPLQTQLARQVASLLSPLPGSLIFGKHGGRPTKCIWSPGGEQNGYSMSCHSPDSWKAMWEEVFRELGGGKVEVKVELKEEIGGLSFWGTWPGNEDPYMVLEWSVTRL
ncbi:hypothetical protein OF83DRAFT_579381 [Amylostereum chailletii]|nr:hypothetical protein OF83DRAFT_579381 [Amylostereum chailletii]